MSATQIFPHVKRIALNGLAVEVLTMMEHANGDLYFINIEHLDEIDKQRMRTILSKRDAAKYPLWDLLDQTTLPNGENALKYFHQMVKGITADGKIFNPGQGRMGLGRPARLPLPATQDQSTEKRGPGRPPKAESGDAPKA